MKSFENFGNYKIACGDCISLMAEIPDKSIDLILCDLPYGTTQNKWDSIIPLDELWKQYWRIIKPNCAIVLTAQCPFDKILGFSQIKYLKYEWIWEKTKATGHLNAKKQPMKAHENILVFYKEQCLYIPQKVEGAPYSPRPGNAKLETYGNFKSNREGSSDGSRYPRSIQHFQHETKTVHPTQKPVPLMEYLIKTYSQEGATVLDNCMGSGTTGIASLNLNREFIGIEKDPSYFQIAKDRIDLHKKEINYEPTR